MQTRQPLRDAQKQGFEQLKTQSWLQTHTFKQQGIGAIWTPHLDKNVSQTSSNNLGNGFVKHPAQVNNVSFGHGHHLKSQAQ
jgi:hypothetical protein